MRHNKSLLISMAGSRKATRWPRARILWSEFVERLKTPVCGTETQEDYLAMPKARQADLKDVGGFVGGTFKGDRRKACLAEGRSLATLDLDNIPAGQTEGVLKRVGGLGCAAAIYSTRKHAGHAPRLRIVIPFDRVALPDEYEPAARKLAELLGMGFCDPTTFDISRLMYWPSRSADAPYVFQAYDNPFCSVDGLLAMYGDWRDATQWPQVPGEEAREKRRLARQEDPTAKRNVIGAFCRTYTVTQAMDEFLPGLYEETAAPGRYTYTGGSTAGGAIVYDGDLFLYSHHATDPCSGLLVNAFDLVRLHKFGELDGEAKEGTPVNKLPSFMEMKRLALEDPEVSALMARERMEEAQRAFQGSDAPMADLDWIKLLAVDGNGNYKKTINNAVLILENDPQLRGKIATDEFASCGMALGALPWDAREEKHRWGDVDDAGYYRYMETYYGITGRSNMDSALLIASERNKVNDVKRYLEGLTWDGRPRVETLLPDYLGADDNAYTRAVMRKALSAAVARAVVGGVKFDCMPIFTGPQGIGKSTFLSILGKEWFSDSLTTFSGKEAAELIQGTWINEVGELSAFSKQETQVIKQFLSKTHDIYRAAYGKRTEKHPRRCVFFGTSNDHEFLKDATGNRRFWPVDVGIHPPKKSVWESLPGETDQIWAEACALWRAGEELFLSKELEALARTAQEAHMETTGKEGLIQKFLEKPVPENWERMDLAQRRMYLGGNLSLPEGTALKKRDRTCAMEVWVECFNGDPKYLKRRDSMEINNILMGTPGWRRVKSTQRYGVYGVQRGFTRA